jgi:hypothetical protein
MIRLLISVALVFAVATSAEAMSPAPLHEPDAYGVAHDAGQMASACCAPLLLSAIAPTAGVWNGTKVCVLSTTKIAWTLCMPPSKSLPLTASRMSSAIALDAA